MCVETVPEEGSPRHGTKSETLRWKLSKDDESQTKTGARSFLLKSAIKGKQCCYHCLLLSEMQGPWPTGRRRHPVFPLWCPGNKAREQGSPAPPRRRAPAPHSGGLALILKLPFAQRKQLTFVNDSFFLLCL